MLCPKCNSSMLSCIDSRPISDTTRRRKECLKCKHRFSTYEYKAERIKELLLKENVLNGLMKAYQKADGKLKGSGESEPPWEEKRTDFSRTV